MNDDEKELRVEQQKSVLSEVVASLAETDSNLYYQSTSEIAQVIFNLIEGDEHKMSRIKHDLVKDLTRRDIEVLIAP